MPLNLTFLMAFPLAALVLLVLLRSGMAERIAIDRPNHRSLHSSPIPRAGGVVILLVLSTTWWFLPGRPGALALLLALLLGLVSYVDDRNGMPIVARLSAHLIASLAYLSGEFGALPLPELVAGVLVITWFANLYNFMDGADGLAGGMAFFGFAAYGVAALCSGDGIAQFSFSITAAALGFLLFNFSPAKVFMGDAGSVPLGFLAAALGAFGWYRDIWPLWFPILVFAPFVVDANVTLLRRIFRRQAFWLPHREHYYQRLVLMGWSHRRLALVEYMLMAACGASAVFLLRTDQQMQFAGLLAWISIFVVGMVIVDLHWKRFLAKVPKA